MIISGFTMMFAIFIASTSVGFAAAASNTGSSSNTQKVGHLATDSTIGDVIRHPAFAGFGRLILPWDNQDYDEGLPINRIGSLLPYHTDVNPDDVVSSLNRMIDDVASGEQIFYPFYSLEEMRSEPSKRNTGLFFFRGRPGAPFAIVCPGGGFAYVGSVHEGFPYAAEISRQGFNVFVLRYRPGLGGKIATQDLAAALTFVMEHSLKLGVSTYGYSLWGSSAGARMAASIGSHGAASFGGTVLQKPAAVVMAYTAHTDLASDEPPTFVAVGSDDGIAPPSAMERRIAALEAQGTVVEYRKFGGVGHGFGLGTGTSASGWIRDAIDFWRRSF